MKKLATKYGLTVAAVVLAAIARWLLDPVLADHLPFPTFFVAVAFAAWFGDWRTSALATVLGFIFTLYLFMPPRLSVLGTSGPHVVGLAAYFFVCWAIASFGESMRIAQVHSAESEKLARQHAETLRISFASVGDAVITTDASGNVTYLNPVAQTLTGWTTAEANEEPLTAVFKIINEHTRQPVENPVEKVLKLGQVIGLANHTILVGRNGVERPIDDTAAPIRDDQGQVVGVVLVFHDITDRRTAEAGEREVEQQVAVTLESITDGFMRLDRDWRVVYVNAEAERIIQRPRKELLGQSHWELFPATVGTKLESEYRRALAERVTVELENFYEPWGRWFEVNGYPSPDGGLAIYFRDITDQKKAVTDLRQSEARFRAGIEAVSSLVWTNNSQGMMEGEQIGWGKFTGQDQESYQGYGWSRAVHPDDAQPTIDAWNEAVADKKTFVFEHRVRRSDGLWRVCSIRAVPVFDGHGVVVEWVGVHTDITDQRQAEQALRSSEARYRAIGEAIDFGVWMCDAHGRNTYASQSFLRLVGITQEQCSNFGWGDLLHPDDAKKTIAAWKECVLTGGVWDREHRFKGVDGQWHYVLARGVPVKHDDGTVLGWVGINLDISRMKQAEGELQEADRRKNEFLATLAHELRNPLAPVRNAIQLLHMKGPAIPELQWARDVIDRQMQAMTHIIDDLMDVSRISRNKLELRRERVTLAMVIQGAVETSRPLIEQHQHELTVTIPPNPIVLDGDLTRLAQVFLNLLNNAAKYTEAGGRIQLTATRQGSDVVVSVRDTGIGITADKLPAVFEMFSQVEESLSRSQGGLGIGLCLVKRLVEMHGGSVEARSAGAGQGSEFIVRLPIVVEESIPKRHDEGEPPAISKLRILVVDDNHDAASTIGMLLKVMGNSVRMAHDGEEAVIAAREFRPQVILLDIGLPKINGYEACRLIREQPEGSNIAIIAVTGWGQEDDRRKSDEAGFDRHMVKPVDPQALMKILAGLSSVSGRKERPNLIREDA